MFTQDEIIEIANSMAFMASIWIEDDSNEFKDMIAFAKLVAAAAASKEREKLKNVAIFDRWYQELDAAVLAEREACESIEYGLAESPAMFATMSEYKSYRNGVEKYRAAIRARGETTLRGEA